MIGRTASSNPWIFRQIAQYLATGRYDVPAGSGQRYEIMRTLLRDAAPPGEDDAPGKMKQFATYFTHGVRNGSKLARRYIPSLRAAKILEKVDHSFHENWKQYPPEPEEGQDHHRWFLLGKSGAGRLGVHPALQRSQERDVRG